MATKKKLVVPHHTLNVGAFAYARGRPIGGSDARQMVNLRDELKARGGRRGVAL